MLRSSRLIRLAVLPLALWVACDGSAPRSPEIFVPAGEFIMGCATDPGCNGTNRPRRPYVAAFYVNRELIRLRDYRRCMDAGVCTEAPPPKFAKDNDIVGVTQDAARIYCTWTGKRLPTSEEWEKAARGTDGRYHPWGNDPHHKCLTGACDGVRSPYGMEHVADAALQWVDHRSLPLYPKGMAAGWGTNPANRATTNKQIDLGHPPIDVAAIRCARSADAEATR